MYCMKCGAQNEDTARFCIRCGAALGTVKAIPPPPPIFPVPVQPRSLHPHPATPTHRRRGIPRWLATCGILTAILLLLGGAAVVGIYFWLGMNRTNQTATMIPADTPLIISFSPDPRQAIYYRDADNLQALLPIFGASPDLREVAEDAQNDLLADFDLDFREDVLPWIGAEVSLAMMDVEASGYRDTPPIILAVATRNEKKSDAFLQKVRQAMEREGLEFKEETYGDIQIVYQMPDYEGAFAPSFATFSHLVVVGSDREALHQAIDNAQTKEVPVLADQEAYQAVLRALPANRLGYVYVDGRSVLQDLGTETGFPLEAQSVQSIGISFGLTSDGVRLDYVMSYDPTQLSSEQQEAMQRQTHHLKTADLVPKRVLAYWSGQDLFMVWFAGGLLAGMRGMQDMEGVQEFVDELEYLSGVRLEDDILANMTGEYALAVLPDPTGLLGDDKIPFGILLLTEVKDWRTVELGLDGLATYLEDEGSIIVRRQEIEGTTFMLLEDPWQEWVFGYGFVDDVLVIATSPEVLRAMLRDESRSLADEDMFKAAIKPLSNKASSYFFLDAQEVIRTAYRMMDEWGKEDFDREVRPYLEPIQAVSMSVEPMDRKGMARGTLFIYTGQK